MDQNEDTPSAKPPAGDPAEAAATPSAGPVAAEPGAQAKTGLASIDSPPLAPEISDLVVAAASGPDTPKPDPIELPAVEAAAAEAASVVEIKPERLSASPPGPRDVVPFAAPAKERASRRFGMYALLAASVVLAAAFGATAGVLATTGLTRLAAEPASAAPPAAPAVPQATQATQATQANQATQTALTQLRAEVAALKASVEATNRSAGAQYTKLVERFDRLERMQSAGGKSDAALPKEAAKETARETTGSVTLPSATAATAAPLAPVPAPVAAIVPGWAVRDVYRGVAMLQSRLGGMIEVEPGDVLPGLGRIEAIRRQEGRWVVVTSKGTITSMR
jgi:hypothetical protein